MDPDHRSAIALGSNIGDRKMWLDRALSMVDRLAGVEILSTSRLYESAGWGREDLDPFLNAVLAAKHTNPPEDFLRDLQLIEDTLGRQRSEKWGPRTIDLDLLACDDHVVENDFLQLPHPWIARRPFVYLPLREVLAVYPPWESLTAPHAEGLEIESDSQPADFGRPVWGAATQPGGRLSVYTKGEAETEALARCLSPYLLAGDTIALTAPMGAGKSVFARGLARGLGIEGPVQSPTFTLCRSYDTKPAAFEHWDFYRLETEDDLESTGFFTLESRESIRAIEWADYFPGAVGDPFLSVQLSVENASKRRIDIHSAAGSLPFFVRAHGRTFGKEDA